MDEITSDLVEILPIGQRLTSVQGLPVHETIAALGGVLRTRVQLKISAAKPAEFVLSLYCHRTDPTRVFVARYIRRQGASTGSVEHYQMSTTDLRTYLEQLGFISVVPNSYPGLRTVEIPRSVAVLDLFAALGAVPELHLGTVEGHCAYSRLRADMWFTSDGQTAFVHAKYRMMMEAAGMSVPPVYYVATIPALRQLLGEFGIYELDHNLARIDKSAPDMPAVGETFAIPAGIHPYDYLRSLDGRPEFWIGTNETSSYYVVVQISSPTAFVYANKQYQRLDLVDVREMLAAAGIMELFLYRSDKDSKPVDRTVETVLADDQSALKYEQRPVGLFAQMAADSS